MNKITVGIILVVMATIMNGCATFKSSVDNKLEKEFNEVKRGPKGAPFKSITTFSESLVCMDNLMQAKGIRDIPVMIEDIEDKTDSVKVGVRDMLISAISEMTVNSHGLKLIIYGKDTANLISYMKAANKTSIYETQPLYDIQGSITQYDKGISSIDGCKETLELRKIVGFCGKYPKILEWFLSVFIGTITISKNMRYYRWEEEHLLPTSRQSNGQS